MAKLRVDNGPGCSKTTLVVINFIFAALGLVVLGLGIYLRYDPTYSQITQIFKVDPSQDASKSGSYMLNLQIASIAIIILGAVISGISIVGMVGACCESKLLIVIYGIVVTILLLGLLAIGGAALIYKYAFNKKFDEEVRKHIKTSIHDYYQGEVEQKSAITVAIDAFQIYFQCCGVDGYQDYSDATNWHKELPDGKTAKAPIACCKFSDEQRKSVLKGQFPKLESYECASSPIEDNSNFDKGCLTELNTHYSRILFGLIITTIVIGLVLIIGAISACAMCRSI